METQVRGTRSVLPRSRLDLDATHSWSPDGQKIVFHRTVVSQQPQIWVMNADGTGQTQLTTMPGINSFPAWGVVRAQCDKGD